MWPISFLKKTVASAASEMGKNAVIHLVKGDKKKITVPKGCKVVEDLDSLGGALVESADGKIRMDLTLETLFDVRRDDIRKQVSDKLFGGK